MIEESGHLTNFSHLFLPSVFEYLLRGLLFPNCLLLHHGHGWRPRICAKDQQPESAARGSETAI